MTSVPSQTPRALGAYIDLLEQEGILTCAPTGDGARSSRIELACDDSREVGPGTLFVCKGAAFKRDYLLSALDSGALAYVSETDYEVDAPALIVTDIRRALAVLADAAWDHPSGDLELVAFTGTKGKTTCAYYLKHLLDAHEARVGGVRAGLFSSIDFDCGLESGPSKLTTPESFELERRLAYARAAGMRYVVMEASSQALKYRRTYRAQFAVGAFTNIGEDHISPIEHPTFEDYFSSKLRLFEQCRVAVVNLDLDTPEHVARVLAAADACERTITYSVDGARADVHAEDVRMGAAGVTARVVTPRFTAEMTIASPLRFNLSNALAAVAVAEGLGIPEQDVVHAFEEVHVPGRAELYPSATGKIVGVVDYAHNGMSLTALLEDLRATYPERELAVVFGATGGKGVDRRQTMGEAAGRLADRIVITEDDPGPEDPALICRAIADAVEAEGMHRWEIVLDRAEAIRTCVRETERDAVVVIAGKGSEDRMLRKDGADPWTPDAVHLKRAMEEYGF